MDVFVVLRYTPDCGWNENNVEHVGVFTSPEKAHEALCGWITKVFEEVREQDLEAGDPEPNLVLPTLEQVNIKATDYLQEPDYEDLTGCQWWIERTELDSALSLNEQRMAMWAKPKE